MSPSLLSQVVVAKTMKEISDVLRTAFTYVGYPIVIVGIFIFIISMIGTAFSHRKSLRAATAAVLPIAGLVFIVVTENEPAEAFAGVLNALPGFLKFVVGAVAAIALLEMGKRLLEADAEIGPPLYVLFLSTTAVFILYAIMSSLLASMHFLLFRFVMGGGMQIIFRGGPEYHEPKDLAAAAISQRHSSRRDNGEDTAGRRSAPMRTPDEPSSRGQEPQAHAEERRH